MKPAIGSLLAAWALVAQGCGPAHVQPASFPDPAVPCPAGLISWQLEVLDQRASNEGGEKMIAAVRDGIERSFPGCRWANKGDANAPRITIAIHRFASVLHDRYYDAAAEWTVTAAEAGGRTLTAFEANEEESRPGYSGAEEDAMNEAFRKALRRTVKGLAAMPRIGSLRPPEGTPDVATLRGRLARRSVSKPMTRRRFSPESPRRPRRFPELERISQPERSEAA